MWGGVSGWRSQLKLPGALVLERKASDLNPSFKKIKRLKYCWQLGSDATVSWKWTELEEERAKRGWMEKGPIASPQWQYLIVVYHRPSLSDKRLLKKVTFILQMKFFRSLHWEAQKGKAVHHEQQDPIGIYTFFFCKFCLCHIHRDVELNSLLNWNQDSVRRKLKCRHFRASTL